MAFIAAPLNWTVQFRLSMAIRLGMVKAELNRPVQSILPLANLGPASPTSAQ
jgi:hypothetical protein